VIGEREKLFENGTWMVHSLFIGKDAPLEVVHDEVDFAQQGGRLLIPIKTKPPIRTSVISWDTADYRAFRHLDAQNEQIDWAARFDLGANRASDAAEKRPENLLVELNGALLRNILDIA
jgi:hypothetical protein